MKANENFSKNFKAIVYAYGFTYHETAIVTGVSTSLVGEILNRNRSLTLNTAEIIAEGLGFSLLYMLADKAEHDTMKSEQRKLKRIIKERE